MDEKKHSSKEYLKRNTPFPGVPVERSSTILKDTDIKIEQKNTPEGQ